VPSDFVFDPSVTIKDTSDFHCAVDGEDDFHGCGFKITAF
jgi:hypothetical protein